VFQHDGPGGTDLPPLLGEHTESVLRMLGYSQPQIASLSERGIVLTGEPHPGRETP